MANSIMIVIFSFAAVISAAVMFFTLTRLKSAKREYFVLFALSVFIYEIGSILDMTARTTEGGIIATKIMYLGSAFAGPLFLMFAQKYSEIILPRIVNSFIMLTAGAIVLLVWTCDYHTLYYSTMIYNNTAPIHHLAITGGPLYMFGMIHPVFCIFTSTAILIWKLRIAEPQKRKRLIIFIACTMIPTLSHVLYIFNLTIEGANNAPIFLTLTMIGLYLGIIKYDLFDNEEVTSLQMWSKEMVANITHDLKIPLTVMSVNLEALSKHAATHSSAEYSRYVRTAYQKNLDLQRLTQNLLEISRIDSGKSFYFNKWESLHLLLTQVRDRYDTYLEDRGIDLDIVLGDDIMIQTDSSKVYSVFDNIIYNAARYTESGGRITITSVNTETSAIVTLTDTGSGIATKHLPKIFERFYKGSQSRGTKEGDSGLGLYIVKSIMEGCGGSVAAESEVGRGTSVILTFRKCLNHDLQD